MTSFCNASLVDADIIVALQPIYTLTCNQIYHTSQDLKILLILRRFQTVSVEIYCCESVGHGVTPWWNSALPQQDLRQREFGKSPWDL